MSTVNIQPADRISEVKEYYFSVKLAEIREMNKSGMPVINMGIGSPDGSPDQRVVETLYHASKETGNHGYQPYTGIPELREAFAAWYDTYYHVSLNPANEILPLIGSKEGIMHIAMAFLNPGDKVLVPNPGYPAYAAASQLVGAQIIYYNLLEEIHWQADLDLLEKQGVADVKLMWVNYPNMPTGQEADMAYFARLIAFAKRNNILIVNDNPYSFILNDDPKSLLAVEGAKEVALELNSLSKSHNMAGWRMGMLAGNKDFIQYVLRVKSNMDSGQFKPLQMAAIEALKLDQSWYDHINAEYRQRRDQVWEMFDLIGCTYSKDQKGMFVWAKVPQEVESARELAEEILQEARVFITPGFIFGSQGERFLRASLCQPAEVILDAVERIKKTQDLRPKTQIRLKT